MDIVKPYKDLIKHLDLLTTDFKAQVIAAELVERNIPRNKLAIKHKSLFGRFVGKDVANYSLEMNDDYDNVEEIVIAQHREGLYDMLPEAVTHSSGARFEGDDIHEFFKRRRDEEKAARTFFMPFENEIEERLLHFELYEREVWFLNNINRNKLFFEFFYGKCNALNEEQITMLLYLLPLSSKIRRNTNMIELVLGKLFNSNANTRDNRKNVKVKKKLIYQKLRLNHLSENQSLLGVNLLSSDFVMHPVWEYTIEVNNLMVEEFVDFQQGGKMKNILDFLLPYFIPAVANQKIKLGVHTSQKDFKIEEDSLTFLEFNTYI